MGKAFFALFIICLVVVKFWLTPSPTNDNTPTPTEQVVTDKNNSKDLPSKQVEADDTPVVVKTTAAPDKVNSEAPSAFIQPMPSGFTAPSRPYSYAQYTVNKGKEHPLAPLFEKTIAESQHFQIAPQKTAVLEGKQGTKVTIPKNSFVKHDGSLVAEKVMIELKEAFTTSSMLLSNLPTQTAHNLLVSDGALYIQATADGEPLQIAKHKQLYIEAPTERKNGEMLVFYGDFDDNGEVTWTDPIRQFNRPLPLPLSALNFEAAELEADLLEKLRDKKYENTLIATREFEKRLLYIQEHKMVHGKRIRPILDYFFKNINLGLLEVDYKLHQYFYSLLKVEPYKNGENVEDLKAMGDQFKTFYEEKWSKPKHFVPYGIDLDSDDAFNQLRVYGMSSIKANSTLDLYDFSKHIAAKKIKQPVTSSNSIEAKYAFQISKIGWVNIDEIYKYHTPKKQLAVNIEAFHDEQLATAVYLAFKDQKTVLSGKKGTDGKYWFNKIPAGQKAFLIALAYKNNQPYIDMVEITTGEIAEQQLSMRPTTLDMLKYQISQVN